MAVLAVLVILRLRGVRIVWCVHNLEPHDASPHLLLVWNLYAGCISYIVDGFVTLSPSTIEIARARFPRLKKRPAIFAWHPMYTVDLSNTKRQEWRRRHAINDSTKVLAFVGFIRPYKGVDDLVSSFLQTTDQNLRLVIAGRTTDNNLFDLLERAAGQDKRILLDLRRLSEQELLDIVSSADAIILPFKSSLHSGSIIYALSCCKLVVTPATAYSNDLKRRVGSRWIRTYKPPLMPDDLSVYCGPPDGRPKLRFLSSHTSASKLKKFYRVLQMKKAK